MAEQRDLKFNHRMKRLNDAYTERDRLVRGGRKPDGPPIVVAAPQSPPSSAVANRSVSVVIAELLGQVTKSLDAQPREATADFLLRCSLTCCFESLGILPSGAFQCAVVGRTLGALWLAMIHEFQLQTVGMFARPTVPDLEEAALVALNAMAGEDWNLVDLSIFGSLVEGALDPKRRHQLGAHFTPREYILRIVRPTIDEPLRADWESARLAARDAKADEALGKLMEFHTRLCATRVLDPACGSGNFLIVALETLYAIEDDVFRELDGLGFARPEERVSPHQMHGIDINAHACEVTKLVLNICALRRKVALGEATWIST